MKKIIKYRELTEMESFSREAGDECMLNLDSLPLPPLTQYVKVRGSGLVKEYPSHLFRRPIFKLRLG